MSFISLMTDFGLKDGNVGVMKGVIWRFDPQAQIADLSHLISPQNVAEAALILNRQATFFPAGTIHLVVVDPGVGTTRRPIAARLGPYFFVGPDNGVLTRLLERAESEGWPVEIVHLDRPQYWLPEVSHVFHGRDIFAPTAGHLAAGVPLNELGTVIHDPVRLQFPQPERTAQGWRGQVIHADHFGNLTTNIRREQLGEHSPEVRVRLRGVEMHGLAHTFGERPTGELVALYGSSGDLIISVVNGSALETLKADIEDPVEVIF